jgi:SAM-dependent methyltransferase
LSGKLRVQFGCGFHAPAAWRNFDASPTLRFEKLPLVGKAYRKNSQRFPGNVEFGDIVRGLPLADGSCVAVYASHVLEHLALGDFQLALANTFRILAPEGYFRLVVPDLKYLARQYVNSADATAAKVFMEETSLGVTNRARGVRGLLQLWLGNSSHLWMWDYEALEVELKLAKFATVRRCKFGDNPLFLDVEQEDRFTNCVAVECRKPGIMKAPQAE